MSSVTVRRIKRMIKACIFVFVLGMLFNIFVLTTSTVQGGSMLPVLEEGDRLVFNKAAYLFDEPEREDIVIIQRPLKNYVKRIIALPGETVEIREQQLIIDGKKYKQHFLPRSEIEKTADFGPVVVPDNSYFVMGDNRRISKDSRNGLGFVTKDEIIGRTEAVILPLTEFTFTR